MTSPEQSCETINFRIMIYTINTITCPPSIANRCLNSNSLFVMTGMHEFRLDCNQIGLESIVSETELVDVCVCVL